jgi:hypothetical protein
MGGQKGTTEDAMATRIREQLEAMKRELEAQEEAGLANAQGLNQTVAAGAADPIGH